MSSTKTPITKVTGNVGAIRGNLKPRASTDDTTPTLSGFLTAALSQGQRLDIFNGNKLLGSAKVNNTHQTWTFTPTTPLTPGSYLFSARVTNSTGAPGARSAFFPLTITTEAEPKARITRATDNVGAIKGIINQGTTTDDSTPTLSGSIYNTSVRRKLYVFNGRTLLGLAKTNKNHRTWSFTPSDPLEPGNYSFSVGSMLGALSASYQFTVIHDKIATATLSVTGTAAEGNSLKATLSAISDPNGATTTAFRWQEQSGSNWSNLSGANSATLSIPSDQSYVGKTVRVVATTTDPLGGTTEFFGDAQTIVNINDAPVASSDTLAATEDTPVTFDATDLLANDTDPDGNTLAIKSVASGTGGTAVLNQDGSVTFSPTANFNGAASFSYIATDGTADSASTTVTVNVAAANAQPTLISTSTTADGSKVVLTYSEALSATTAAADAFTLTQDGSLVPVTAAVVNGSTVELSLAWPVTGGRSLSVSYTDPSNGNDANAIQSLSGVDAASLVNAPAANLMADAIPPVFQYAATSADGGKLILTFSKALSATLPETGAFSVVVAGSEATVTDVAQNGNSIELSLASSITNGQAITVSYSDGSDADVTSAIQDNNGNDAPAFSDQAVRNTVGTTIYYISPTGSDTTGDGSEANPFATLSKVHGLSGAAELGAGDTVYFLEGTYRNSNFGDGNIWKDSLSDFVLLLNKSGAADNPITYAAAPGAKAILEFDGPGAIRLQNAQYINIQGFEIKGQNSSISLEDALAHQFEYRIDTDGDGDYLDEVSWLRPTTALTPGTTVLGKNQDGTDYVMPATTVVNGKTVTATLNNLGAKTPGSFGANAIVIAGSSNHIQILNNSVHDAPGAGISSLTGADYVLIRGNTFYNNNWFTPSGTHAISFKNISSSDTFTGAKVIVDGNSFSDNYSRLISWAPLQNDEVDMVVDEGKTLHVQNSTSASGWTHGQVQFSNNQIVRSGNAAITVNNAERIVMANNTIIDSGYLNRLIDLGLVDPNIHEGFQVSASGFRLGGTSLTVINNLISSSTGQTINGALQPLNVVDATAAVTGSGAGASLFANNLYFNGTEFLRTTTGNAALDAGFIPVDTLEELGFVDPAKGNYLLLRTSPAINQGQTGTTNADLVLPGDLTGLVRDGLIDLGAFEFVGDALPPAPGTLSVSGKDDNLDNNFSLVLSGQEAGSTVVLEASANGGTIWASTTANQTDVEPGSYRYRAKVSDAAGNQSYSEEITVFVASPDGPPTSEGDIPLALDSDGDGLANTIDTDDDNDGILDNNDAQPLNSASSAPLTESTTVTTTADAALRGNTNSNANTNYGSDATAQTKNGERGLLMKFSLPTDGILQSATLRLYTSTEDDPLDVYLVADNSWTEGGLTYNNINWKNSVYLGETGAPSAGIYSYTLPQNAAFAPGQTVSLYVEDPDDPNGSVEALFTKETAGKAPSLLIEKSDPSPLNISVSDQEVYRNGGSFTVNVSMRSAPAGVVYAPLAVSDPSIASIVGASVLTFTPDNWADPQTVQITPDGVGTFTLVARPLHSSDANFNGINPDDVAGFKVTAIDLAAETAVAATTGAVFMQDLQATSAVNAGAFRWKVLSGPEGLNVVENSGQLMFRPTSDQAGLNTTAILQGIDEFGNTANFEIPITVSAGSNADLAGIYVVPGIGSDSTGTGIAANPYGSIAYALDRAAATNQSTVFIRGGEYSFGSSKQTITTAASSEIVVKPLPGEHVKLNFSGFTGFDITSTATNITFEGLEIDGGSDSADFWDIVSVGFWTPDQISRGGGIAFNVDGQFITLRDNYIHDAYQKAVEIKDGRYVEVDGNIIRNIATTSLSGGHGIMRQQKGAEFFDNDLPGELRWDITGNLIFNVEQRIYSWVPSKGFIEMVLDEGKPILIDDPKDTDGSQEQMSARISNNVVAYGAIDGIRLKSTPNLEVSNNSVFSQAPLADGVSDRDGDTSTPKFTNFEFTNNAVQVSTNRFAVEIDDALADAGAGAVVSGNVVAGGQIKPSGQAGISNLGNVDLFTDALNGDFSINSTLNLSGVGVDPAILAELNARTEAFGVEIGWDRWEVDHLKLTQTILDNIPGVNDGVVGNEIAFTDQGTFNAARTTLYFETVNGAWKTSRGAASTMDFHLNSDYTTWYKSIENNYKQLNGTNYSRIRWGDSVLAQNQVFAADGLLVSKVVSKADESVSATQITAKEHTVTLGGDLLIDLYNYNPGATQSFDLIRAQDIQGNFNRVVARAPVGSGEVMGTYKYEIVTENGDAIYRLTVSSSTLTNSQNLVSPLVIDLDGDGIELLSLDHEIHFDLDGNGSQDRVGWTGTREAFLALDLNRNGLIDSGAELFGTATQLPDGSTASNGFEALAQYDTNADLSIDASDAIYADLRGWVDSNSDATSDSAELHTLNELGIASISLAYQTPSFQQALDGGLLAETATATRNDGTTTAIVDVWFEQQNTMPDADPLTGSEISIDNTIKTPEDAILNPSNQDLSARDSAGNTDTASFELGETASNSASSHDAIAVSTANVEITTSSISSSPDNGLASFDATSLF